MSKHSVRKEVNDKIHYRWSIAIVYFFRKMWCNFGNLYRAARLVDDDENFLIIYIFFLVKIIQHNSFIPPIQILLFEARNFHSCMHIRKRYGKHIFFTPKREAESERGWKINKKHELFVIFVTSHTQDLMLFLTQLHFLFGKLYMSLRIKTDHLRVEEAALSSTKKCFLLLFIL